MKILFLDFETQSDLPNETNPTEVGATFILVGPGKNPDRGYVKFNNLSALIYDPSYPPQTDEIVELTGITDEMLKERGRSPLEVFTEIGELIGDADYAIAHNKSFDQVVYESTCRRIGVKVQAPKNGWICSIQDVNYPKKYKCKKLSHLAYDHGVIVDPSTLHRAVADTELLARLITTKYDIEDIIAYRDTPWVYLRACAKPPWEDGGAETGIAKKLKYGWEKVWGTDIIFQKCWVKRVKETEIEFEKAAAPFKLMKLIPPEQDVP